MSSSVLVHDTADLGADASFHSQPPSQEPSSQADVSDTSASESTIETIETVEAPSVSTELRQYANTLAQMNWPLINRLLDATLRENLLRATRFLHSGRGLSVAQIAHSLLMLRDDFEQNCPETTRRLLRLASSPSVMGIIFQLAGSSTFLDAFLTMSGHNNNDWLRSRLRNPLDALQNIDMALSLTLVTWVNAHCLNLRSIGTGIAFASLIVFTCWHLLTIAESMQLLHATLIVWSVSSTIVNRIREHLRVLAITNNAALQLALLSAGVAFLHGQLLEIGLISIALCSLFILLFMFLPEDFLDVFQNLSRQFPSMHLTERNAPLVGFVGGTLVWLFTRNTVVYFPLFKLSLNVVIHSFFKATE